VRTNEDLKQIAIDTIKILKSGKYTVDKKEIDIKDILIKCILNTTLFQLDSEEFKRRLLKVIVIKKPDGFKPKPPILLVTNKTSIETILESDEKLAVLNFASAKNPGGGFLHGAMAQEETLTRSSGLYPSLLKFQKEYYDFHVNRKSIFYSHRIIISPDCVLIKNDVGELLKEPKLVSFITCAAPKCVDLSPIFTTDKTLELEQTIQTIVHRRIFRILSAMYLDGYENIVLGAWGCGVFRNNPYDVAESFRYHLAHTFDGKFKRIIFPIPIGKNDKNNEIFREVLLGK